MRIFKQLTILFFLVSFPLLLSGQEKIVELELNPEIRKKIKDGIPMLKSYLSPDTLDLPFFEDFSKFTIYPSADRWEDQNAFVNMGFGENPPSLGVATFDVLDSTGMMYDRATTFSFIGDYLTSKPIDLEGAGNDVYLSFYFQKMGKGDYPNDEDSLNLEFFSPLDNTWNRIWSLEGMADSIYKKLYTEKSPPFKQVIIPVSEAKYLKRGFKFRFYNLASITDNDDSPGRRSNCDQWNIDYILLDKNRFLSDTVPHDVAVSAPLQSLLKNYEAMPWKHFREVFLSQMGSSIPLSYINQDSIVRNVTRNFKIDDVYFNTTVHSYTGGALNIDPWDTIHYKSALLYTYNSPADKTALFKVQAYLVTDDFDKKENDTAYFDQYFGSYFAYDDGTSEAGYGLDGQGTENASVAFQFVSYIPDSLKAVQIYFNEVFNDANDGYFNLMVWDNNDGKPGNVLYEAEYVKPEFSDSLNIFYSYKLETAIPVSGVFYVGWQQVSDLFLNVGFDRNRIKNDRLFYKLSSTWSTSKIPGALMVRPVLESGLITGKKPGSELFEFSVYPNPVQNSLRINYDSQIRGDDFSLILYSIQGRIVQSYYTPVNEIDVSTLTPGVYIIEVKNSEKSERKKILKISR